MSLKGRIESLTGFTVATMDADRWLEAGAEEIINLLPRPCLFTVSKIVQDDGSGAAVSSCRLVGAHKDGRPAREVSAARKAELTDSGSILQATAFRPAAYREAGKVFVEPGGGTVEVAEYPTGIDSGSDDRVDGLPDDTQRLVILYAAQQAIAAELHQMRVELKGSYGDFDMAFDDDDSEMAEVALGKLREDLREDAERHNSLVEQSQLLQQQYQSGIQALVSQYQPAS